MKRLCTIVLLIVISLVACNPPSQEMTGAAVVAAFRDAGLEAENARPMTPHDYGAAPYICEGTRFLIPSLCEDCGGRIFVCADSEERDSLAIFYREMGEISAWLFSWVYVEGLVVVQINGDLDAEMARRYERAIP